MMRTLTHSHSAHHNTYLGEQVGIGLSTHVLEYQKEFVKVRCSQHLGFVDLEQGQREAKQCLVSLEEQCIKEAKCGLRVQRASSNEYKSRRTR